VCICAWQGWFANITPAINLISVYDTYIHEYASMHVFLCVCARVFISVFVCVCIRVIKSVKVAYFWFSLLQCVVVCSVLLQSVCHQLSSLLQLQHVATCVKVYYNVHHLCISSLCALSCSVLRCVLQCVAVCCSMLLCAAVCLLSVHQLNRATSHI